MIRIKDITLALTAHIKTAPSTWWPVVWENKDDALTDPRIIYENVRVSTTDRTLDGGCTNHRGFLVLTAVADLDQFATQAEDMADIIADHFPYPSFLDVTGGRISFITPPEPLQGFRDKDKSEWRVPVRINYLAH